MVKGEVDLAMRRLQRKLPAGYLGFPIYQEIKYFRTIFSNGLQDFLQESRRKYGTLFAQKFLGRIIVNVGEQEGLDWLFMNDRKALTEVSWPANVAMLMGPGSVLNQTGRYHRVLRRLLEPYFAPTFVNNNYLAVMDETTLEQLRNWSSSGEFLLSEVFNMYTLRLFYAASFGYIDEEFISILSNDFKVRTRLTFDD